MGPHTSRPRASSPRSSGEARAILNDLRRLVRALRVSARDVEKEVGISGAQLFVLQCLGGNEVLSMKEIAERTHTDQSSVSVVVRRLVERGLVERTPSQDDARRAEVRLTARGRRIVRSAPETAQARLAEALGAMPRTATKQLAAGLSELVGQMRLEGSPRMFFEEEAPARSRAARKRSPRG